MSIKVAIFDKSIPMLDFIAERHFGLARESLSVAGAKIRDAQQKAIRQFSHHWHNERTANGKRRIYYSKKKKRTLGKAIASSKFKHDNIADIMSFWLPNSEKSLTAVIGGSHNTFTPIKYVDGENVGYMKKVKKRGTEIRAIYHKLGTGEVTDEHPYKKRGTKKRFEDAEYVARQFQNKGISMAKNELKKSLTKRYVKVLPRVANRANIKPVMRVS